MPVTISKRQLDTNHVVHRMCDEFIAPLYAPATGRDVPKGTAWFTPARMPYGSSHGVTKTL
jgi:hypothetical protein